MPDGLLRPGIRSLGCPSDVGAFSVQWTERALEKSTPHQLGQGYASRIGRFYKPCMYVFGLHQVSIEPCKGCFKRPVVSSRGLQVAYYPGQDTCTGAHPSGTMLVLTSASESTTRPHTGIETYTYTPNRMRMCISIYTHTSRMLHCLICHMMRM